MAAPSDSGANSVGPKLDLAAAAAPHSKTKPGAPPQPGAALAQVVAATDSRKKRRRPSLIRALKRYNPGPCLCKAVGKLRDKYVRCCISASERGGDQLGHLAVAYGSCTAAYPAADAVGRCSVDRRPADDDVARISSDWAADFLLLTDVISAPRRACGGASPIASAGLGSVYRNATAAAAGAGTPPRGRADTVRFAATMATTPSGVSQRRHSFTRIPEEPWPEVGADAAVRSSFS